MPASFAGGRTEKVLDSLAYKAKLSLPLCSLRSTGIVMLPRYKVLHNSILMQTSNSDSNPFDLIQRDLVTRSVIQLGRSGTLVGCNRLGVFDCATVFKVRSDSCGSKRVATNLSG